MLNHFYEASGYAQDSRYDWNYFSVAHGANFINRNSADFPSPETWNNKLPIIGIRRSVPGYFRIEMPGGNCVELEGAGHSNGTDFNTNTCSFDDDQQFVYTAEFQLRSKEYTRNCMDVVGANNGVGEWDNIHAWKCHGGHSPKFGITDQGTFKNYHSYSKDLCLGIGGGNAGGTNQQLYLRGCVSQAWATRTVNLRTANDFNLNNHGGW